MEIEELIDKIGEIEKVESVIVQDYWEGDSLEGFVMMTVTCEDGVEEEAE